MNRRFQAMYRYLLSISHPWFPRSVAFIIHQVLIIFVIALEIFAVELLQFSVCSVVRSVGSSPSVCWLLASRFLLDFLRCFPTSLSLQFWIPLYSVLLEQEHLLPLPFSFHFRLLSLLPCASLLQLCTNWLHVFLLRYQLVFKSNCPISDQLRSWPFHVWSRLASRYQPSSYCSTCSMPIANLIIPRFSWPLVRWICSILN